MPAADFGGTTPRARGSEKTPPPSSRNSYRAGTSETFSMYTTRDAASPARTSPKSSARADSATAGPTPAPRAARGARLPLGVVTTKRWKSDAPLARGV